MMRRATLLDRYSDYFLLVKPRPAGARIGSYSGDPIPAAVVDEFGRRYVYVGHAPRRLVGGVDTPARGPGEWDVAPRRVYRCVQGSPAQGGRRFALLSWLGGLGRAGPKS